jgi:RNA polymerase sigma factor (sigma-70 family)
MASGRRDARLRCETHGKRGKFAVESTDLSSDNPVAVRDINPYLDDFHFAQELLEGKSSSLRYFQEAYRPQILAFLKKNGASPLDAEDIFQNLWSDCITPTDKRGPKLERYHGGCALQSWLNTIALNSLISKRRNADRWKDILKPSDAKLPNGDDRPDGPWSGPVTDHEPDRPLLLALMRYAIDTAFQECAPEDFVLLQLAHCDQLKEKELALMFRCDVGTISRRLQRAGKGINRATLRHIKDVDPLLRLKWDDFMELCRSTSPSYFEEE